MNEFNSVEWKFFMFICCIKKISTKKDLKIGLIKRNSTLEQELRFHDCQKFQPFFLIGGDYGIKKRGTYLTK